MSELNLAKVPSEEKNSHELRLRQPNRDQVTPVPTYLDDVLPDDHLARLLWQALEEVDLSGFYASLIVKPKGPGRGAADPRLMVALWLYATSEGVTSARELGRLCQENLAYIWLCGGVSINYHSLSDFRTQQGQALDQLMDELITRLIESGLVELSKVAQDGMRVRASAGAASFRREETLKEHLAQAREVREAHQPNSEPQPSQESHSTNLRQEKARQRANRERVERLEAALSEMPEARQAKPKDKQDRARVSTTDAQARVMKMPDGGFRPAYNFQLAVDTASRVIVGVDVTNSGSDQHQMPPMIDQVELRCGNLPDYWLSDGGFASQGAIEEASAKKVCVLAPVQQPKDPERDPHLPLATDSDIIGAWRVRMGTDEAKETYKLRAATVEWANAQARVRYGVQQLRVRGLDKVRCVALWVAIAHNFLIYLRHLYQPPTSGSLTT